ncbi:MAG: maleylpyruvate isomerase N-terminal domain-containing protein [Actinomycetota bacterium]
MGDVPSPVSSADLLAAFESSSHHIASAVADLGVVPVPGCAPWTTLDLLLHLGQVYVMVDDTVTQRATEPLRPGPRSVPPPAGRSPEESLESLLDWYETRRRTVLRTLADTDPSERVWTWAPPSEVRFYFRRMAHETAIHLLDLEPRRVPTPTTASRDIVTDGIEEYFAVVVPGAIIRRKKTPPTGTLHLHCIDGDGEWLATVNDSGAVDLRHEHAKGDVAWRGPALDLFAALWGRSRPGVEVLGDPDVSRQWSELAP